MTVDSLEVVLAILMSCLRVREGRGKRVETGILDGRFENSCKFVDRTGEDTISGHGSDWMMRRLTSDVPSFSNLDRGNLVHRHL